jgi:hypothetical protein
VYLYKQYKLITLGSGERKNIEMCEKNRLGSGETLGSISLSTHIGRVDVRGSFGGDKEDSKGND